MHDVRWIRENADAFVRGLERRGVSDSESQALLGRLVDLDAARRSTIVDLEQAQKKQNDLSKEIGRIVRQDQAGSPLIGLRDNLVLLKTKIKNLEQRKDEFDRSLKLELLQIPNLPLDEVPNGRDARDNVEHHRFGARRDYTFSPKQHFDLGEALSQMDFDVATKLSGARFVVLKKELALLERALGQFMLDVHTREHGYTEINPPLMVRDSVMVGTAQLPKFADDQYQIQIASFEKLMERIKIKALDRLPSVQERHKEIFDREMTVKEAIESFLGALTRDMDEYRELYEQETGEVSRLWLIPTAEVPLTNLVRESIVDEAQLPMRLTACTPCFRAEAGAAGKDTRGMIRQHQFTKVELVSITTPEQSKDEHERMLACAEEVLRRLDLHYRVVTLCTGDMGFASQKTYDIEVWLPGQNMYREISSCSVCGEFQARRMNVRYRSKEGRNIRHVHTLNGSGVAVGRALIAVMETYQQADGSIAVPDVLQPYMGGMKKIEK